MSFAIHKKLGTIKEIPKHADGWMNSEWVVYDNFPTKENYFEAIAGQIEPEVGVPSENSFGQWIKVEDRLPERGESVLTYDPTEIEEPFCINELYQAMDKKLRWDFGQEGITHWMPIKEIPLPKF